MLKGLLLLLCLTGHVFAKEPPDVDCLVVHLKYVHCSWNMKGTPEVNYTFTGWFSGKKITECPIYLSETDINIGCEQPYEKNIDRFSTFFTKLVHGNHSVLKEHQLKSKVKLYPPTRLTVQMGVDSNLWYYWNQTASNCVESEIRYRTNNKKWETSTVSSGRQNYCINMPTRNSLYELQVRSRIEKNCGESVFWSDWSEPVSWGSNNSTDTNQMSVSMSVWTPVLSALGTLTSILLLIMLLHHERVRIIFLPVVPKPSLISHDMKDWKETFNPNYNERACLVREYCPVSQSESFISSTSSVATDQTDCSVVIPADESDLSTSCSSSTSTVLVSSEEAEQVSV